jgi:hypothetical protein
MSRINNNADCVICDNKVGAAVICSYCKFECCRSCYESNCLEKKNMICMNCKKMHDNAFFYNNTSSSFRDKKWKKLISEKLFQEEESKFPITQAYIARYNELIDKQIDIYNKLALTEKEVLYENEKCMLHKTRLIPLKYKNIESEAFKELRNIIRRLKYRLEMNKRLLYDMKNNMYNWNPNEDTDESTDEIKEDPSLLIVMGCMKSECRGYVTKKYTCGICETKYCKDCRNICDDEHKCNADDIASVKLLDDTTKPCPKCKISISKIDGCDQMWCINCKTAFSWSNGTIENGLVHNPHYFEYLRRTQGSVPRYDENNNINNNICDNNGNIINPDRLLNIMMPIIRLLVENSNTTESDYLLDIIRRNNHINGVFINGKKFRIDRDNDVEYQTRIDYLTNKINKEKFISLLFSRNQRLSKNHDIRLILEMVFNSVNDSLHIYTRERNINNIKKNISQIIKIANNAFINISKVWNCKEYKFDDELNLNC